MYSQKRRNKMVTGPGAKRKKSVVEAVLGTTPDNEAAGEKTPVRRLSVGGKNLATVVPLPPLTAAGAAAEKPSHKFARFFHCK